MEMPGDVSSVQTLRRATRRFLVSGEVSEDDAGDIELIIGELATNALRHGPLGGDFSTHVELSPDTASVSVTDSGAGFSPEAAAQPGTVRPEVLDDAAEHRVGGFGLMLVRAVADSVTIDNHPNDGTTVSATKMLHKAKTKSVSPIAETPIKTVETVVP